MFLSGVTNSSEPVASAALGNSPLTKSVPSGLFRFRDGVAFKKRDQRRGRSVVKEYTHPPSGLAAFHPVGELARAGEFSQNARTGYAGWSCPHLTSTLLVCIFLVDH
jgi:hypothetical protein